MAKSATHFHPTTDTFGELTLHARRFGSYFTTTTWDGFSAGVDRKALTNTVIMVLFLLGFFAGLAGLFVVDQLAFQDVSASQVYYGGVGLIDYD